MKLEHLINRWYIKVVLPRLEPRYQYQSGAHEKGWFFAELQNRGVIICTATMKDGQIVFDNDDILAGLSENARLNYLEYVHEVLDPLVGKDLVELEKSWFQEAKSYETK